MDFRAVPPAYPGQRIGLYGGSFDPAHTGHRLAAETAAKRLNLDRVWWLVTPQNPLKTREASPLSARIASARRQARGRRMVVSDLESRLGLSFSADTLKRLRGLRPGVRFFWIMGADTLPGFHHWRRWREIMETTPIAIIARAAERGRGLDHRAGPAFARFAQAQRTPASLKAAPGWARLFARLNPASSSTLRAAAQTPVAP